MHSNSNDKCGVCGCCYFAVEKGTRGAEGSVTHMLHRKNPREWGDLCQVRHIGESFARVRAQYGHPSNNLVIILQLGAKVSNAWYTCTMTHPGNKYGCGRQP